MPAVSLHVHERIDPRTIIEAVRKRTGSEEPAIIALLKRCTVHHATLPALSRTPRLLPGCLP